MAKKKKSGALYFTDVARIEPGGVALIGNFYSADAKDEQIIAFLTFRDGEWGIAGFSGIGHALRFTGDPKDPKREYLILERNRGLYRKRAKDYSFERINEDREGFLMDLRRIGKTWYTVGGHHQIYREEKGGWLPVDQGIYIGGEKGEAKVLLSIDGSSEMDIYTVGFNGVIFHFNGKAWSQLDSPTNVGLQRVLCVSKDEVYLCGYANALYRGNTDGWTPLTEPDDNITYWDMAYFKGKVYVCTKKKLYVLNDDRPEEVEIPVKGPLGFYRMDSDKDELWTCGNECLLKFDGKKWEQFVYPENV